MKIPIAASLLILAIGAGLGWHDRQQLATLRTTQRQLAAEAVKFGAPSDPAHNSRRSTKRERPNRFAAAAKLSTAELIDLAKTSHLSLLFDGLSGWDPAEIKAALTSAVTNPDVDERTRMLLHHACTTVLANDHPQAALEIFTSSPELFAGTDRGRSLVLTALACLARNDLTTALVWVRDHPQHFPQDTKSTILSAVAEQDPQHAFQLITELDLKPSNQVLWPLIDKAKTMDQKSAALAGLRQYLLTIPDEKTRDQLAGHSIGGLARSLRWESFDSTTRWIAGENLTPQELGALIGELDISTHNGETGRWIEWLRQPDRATDPRVKHLIYQWACNDYQAAMQWAVSQPPGKDRAQILKTIHGNWPKQDPAGKETFAQEHGIK